MGFYKLAPSINCNAYLLFTKNRKSKWEKLQNSIAFIMVYYLFIFTTTKPTILISIIKWYRILWLNCYLFDIVSVLIWLRFNILIVIFLLLCILSVNYIFNNCPYYYYLWFCKSEKRRRFKIKKLIFYTFSYFKKMKNTYKFKYF